MSQSHHHHQECFLLFNIHKTFHEWRYLSSNFSRLPSWHSRSSLIFHHSFPNFDNTLFGLVVLVSKFIDLICNYSAVQGSQLLNFQYWWILKMDYFELVFELSFGLVGRSQSLFDRTIIIQWGCLTMIKANIKRTEDKVLAFCELPINELGTGCEWDR